MDALKQFRNETEADPRALARAQRRIDQALQPRPVEPLWRRLVQPAPVAAGLLLAGALWMGLMPPPDAPIPAAALEEARAMALSGGRVQLSWEGSGTVEGTDQAPRIGWESGEISVEVEPDQGIGLEVRTREAQVRVIGTGFAVRRDALGTTVAVRHGTVEVTCAGSGAVRLTEGQSRSCLPVSAAGLLARARAQQGAGAPAADWLGSVEAGLKAPDGSPGIEGELRVLQLQALEAVGRIAEARAVAEDYVRQPRPARVEEVRRYAAMLALQQQDCAAAIPHLSALTAPAVGDLLRLADCEAGSAPENARRHLEAARAVCNTPEERSAVDTRLIALGKGD